MGVFFHIKLERSKERAMGCGEEFKTIDLGDRRLNRRAVLLAERLGQKPSASIPNACQSWAETAAAYRF